jgi:hypothetical protein
VSGDYKETKKNRNLLKSMLTFLKTIIEPTSQKVLLLLLLLYIFFLFVLSYYMSLC